jgi:Lariat debranching enzyme, C-terminal domain
MPQKYRRMGDFHEYYSGARVAPYLTPFIGGNHEASNYLFELYYGGWVAPNIYYMGAANVLRLGPLRIAGLSGIWKGYDYRKSHFERLPYNRDAYHSIFHVRELDVRKLLSVRTQVDVGLSHDWPQGVEWCGQHRWLFGRKDRFEAEAINGKLGSVPAAQCLDRLRPAYWFSAHLHIKYPALVQHEQAGGLRMKPSITRLSRDQGSGEDFSKTTSTFADRNVETFSPSMSRQLAPTSPEFDSHRLGLQDRPRVSAWQNFHVVAEQDDAKERDRILKERQERQDEEANTGIRSRPQYTFEETFKQVETNGSLGRSITSVTTSSPVLGESTEVSNLDGCGTSSLKRRRETSSPEVSQQLNQPNEHASTDTGHSKADTLSAPDGTAACSTAITSPQENNPDAIEIDLDDTDSEIGDMKAPEDVNPGSAAPIHVVTNVSAAIQVPTTGASASTTSGSHEYPISTGILSDDSEDGGVHLNPLAQSFHPLPSMSPSIEREKRNTEPLAQQFRSTSSDPERRNTDAMSPLPQSFTHTESVPSRTEPQDDDMDLDGKSTVKEHSTLMVDDGPGAMSKEADEYEDAIRDAPKIDNEVSEEMRAQLAALSSSFAPQLIGKSESLPFPEAITNKTTNFLALDKCEPNRQFLQLLEVEAISDPLPQKSQNRPFKLQYDPEWLAILRVFAPDLELGGNPSNIITHGRGETYYRNCIAREKKWVDEHIVEKNLLEVPENFTTTAPIYDPDLRVNSSEMPREYTNPQTGEFCKLLGIDNPFDISEEERDARMAKGSRVDTDQRDFRGARHEGRGRGGNRGGGGPLHSGGGGMGGRGGGRGRGRARW